MNPGPAYPDPGRDEDPARSCGKPDNPLRRGAADRWLLPPGQDWMDAEQRAAYLASLAEEEEPDDPDLWEDPDNAPPPGLDDAELASLMAGAREVAGARFAAGTPLDGAPGCTALMGFADDAAGDDDRYVGASDDDVIGAICAWDRVEAHAAARKHAAVAEIIRRCPEPGCVPEGEAQMPEMWDEFLADELASALAESRFAAENVLDLARFLEVKLPGTKAAFRAGMLRQGKVEIIARATQALNPAEARAAEALVLGRAGRLTPGGLRAAIARAVMEVAPDKARKRREEAAKDTRVERWAEDSGNAALAGRELPPAEVLAADQRITWWAKELRKAGLPGDMDELRARAYLDILLGMDSRPGRPGTDTAYDQKDGQDGSGGGRPGSAGPGGPAAPGSGGTRPGAIPPGFVGRVTLTVPLSTALGLAERPGETPGIGPIDPALARDLADAAARNPKTTWCVTVTDEDGHAIGHGCARPEPSSRRTGAGKQRNPRRPSGHDPPGEPASAGGATRAGEPVGAGGATRAGEPVGAGGATRAGGAGNRHGPSSQAAGQVRDPGQSGIVFTAADQPGPAGGYGSWRLSVGASGQPGLIVDIEPVATDECDHRHEAKGHDPGIMLRHLVQVRHVTCTGPTCRRPATQCDFEHNIPYEAGGRTCMCNGGPKCRRDHRLKQDPRWKVEQVAPAVIRWTSPTGRQYTTEATRYPI
jgi:Domain of unknown function (DUF222)